ncbi:MAG: NAD(P)H-dependent oxidoreductase subunit E [Candidatus Riflebacteria bacterium]|nr:NAD(P)H-dependent oxidoreductase subunit E [Candidatus Riflebacteria bacterium]
MKTPDLTKLDTILERHEAAERSLIQVLQDVQKEYRYLPREAFEKVGRHCGVSVARVYSTATFYKAFSLVPQGEKLVRVCAGTACHVRGAGLLLDELERALSLEPGKTSPDGKITLKTVNCVGACAMAPCVMIDGEAHGNVKPGEVVTLVKGGRRDAAAD